MARRTINIQRDLGKKVSLSSESGSTSSTIDELAERMATIDVGFQPTDQRVYEINLERLMPDPNQPRHLLPYDLRQAIHAKTMSPTEAMRELLERVKQGDMVARLILGSDQVDPVSEEDSFSEERGLLALAESIRTTGLRQPLNVYQVDDPTQTVQIVYRIGEGERRFWAHHLLVQHGYEKFKSVRCIVDTLPENEDVIYQRQEAENAARVDLPSIARSRSMERIKSRLEGNLSVDETSQRELQIAIGQKVKSFTGRAIGDRMVRNYLSLLKLSPEAQDLVEAALLSEKQLRPVMRLTTDAEQLALIRQIIEERWSSRQVFQKMAERQTALREVSQSTVEQRFEKRVIDAAKIIVPLLSLPAESYESTIMVLAHRAKDLKTFEALQGLQRTLADILQKATDLIEAERVEVPLGAVIPPLNSLKQYLPFDKFQMIEVKLWGSQILDQLLAWQQRDTVLAHRLRPFFRQLESEAETLQVGKPTTLPIVLSQPSLEGQVKYTVQSGELIYWAHELLVKRGEERFKVMKAELG